MLVHENLTTSKFHLGLDARNVIRAKLFTGPVINFRGDLPKKRGGGVEGERREEAIQVLPLKKKGGGGGRKGFSHTEVGGHNNYEVVLTYRCLKFCTNADIVHSP